MRTIERFLPTVTQTKAADAVQSLRFMLAPLIAVALMAALLFGVGSSAQSIWSSSGAQTDLAPAIASLPVVAQAPGNQPAGAQMRPEQDSGLLPPSSAEPLQNTPVVAVGADQSLVAVVNGAEISAAHLAQARSVDLAMSSLMGLPPTAASELVEQAINHQLVLQQAGAAGYRVTDTPQRLAQLLSANGKTQADLQESLRLFGIAAGPFEAYLADLMTADQFARQAAQQQGTALDAYLAQLRRTARISYGPAADAPLPPTLPAAAAAAEPALAAIPAASTPLPTPAPEKPQERGVLVGQLAPLFALQPLKSSGAPPTGAPVTLQELEGAPTVLSFWTTWCPYCLRQTPILVAGAQRYAEQGLRFVGIDVGETQDVVAAYAGQHAIPYPILLDPQSEAAGAYAVSGYPTTYFLDADGRIVAHHIGALTEEQLDQYVEQLLVTHS